MENLITILQIPERCLLNKKITKVFFKRNFDLTSSEKVLLDDFNIVTGIEWLARINPANANIVRYQDEQYLFEEVQIISVQSNDLNFERNHIRIAELLQKYIPYPIVLCIWYGDVFVLNTCDKKVNQNDRLKRIIEKRYTSEVISKNAITENHQQFLKSLAFAEMDKTNLKTYYDSYTKLLIALQSSSLSGVFIPRSNSRTKIDMDRLEKIELLRKEIIGLQNELKIETQLSNKVAINIHIKDIEKQLEALISELK